MSNFKKRFSQVRTISKKLEKKADNTQPAQISVQEEPDMTGYTAKIEEALKVTISPTTIDGFVEEHSGELNITMSNGDKIELKYETDETTNTQTNSLTINGTSVTLQPNFDPSQLTTAYKQALGLQ